jgi:hypothetical protein
LMTQKAFVDSATGPMDRPSSEASVRRKRHTSRYKAYSLIFVVQSIYSILLERKVKKTLVSSFLNRYIHLLLRTKFKYKYIKYLKIKLVTGENI